MTTTLRHKVKTNLGIHVTQIKTNPVINTSKFSHLQIIFDKNGEVKIYNKNTGRYED